MGYDTVTQSKNTAWFLPRPPKSKYPGGMPLHCEKWLFELSSDLLHDCTQDGKTFHDLHILNLFCGMNEYGTRVDIKEEVKPDIVADAHDLQALYDSRTFDVILADPPYSNDESKQIYDTGKLNYKTWTAECDKILRPGGLLIVYHKYIMPNPNPKHYRCVRRVFIGHRTYHTPRVALYFQKQE